jgi:hypothetical protein
VEKRFTPRTHRFCLWTGGPVMSVLYIFGWVVFARLVPAPAPVWPAQRLSDWLVGHQIEFLIGCAIMIGAAGLWGMWCAALSVWTFKTESRFPVLFAAQIISVAAGLTIFILDELFWTVAAFRAGQRSPEITQAIWDIGWFGFLFSITLYIAWAVSLALGILWNPPEHQLFPRWAGFMTIGSALCWSAGLLIVFFKQGQFAYNGGLAMWLPLGEFFVWLAIMTFLGLRAISHQEELSRREAMEKGAHYGIYKPDEHETFEPIEEATSTEHSPQLVGELAGHGTR